MTDTITVTIPRLVSIEVKKTGQTYDVDMSKVNAAGMMEYWLSGNQRLKDALSAYSEDKGHSKDVMHNVVLKSLDAIYSGNARIARTTDPVKAEALRLAIGAVEASYRKAGKKGSAKEIRAKAEAYAENFMERARENVELRDDVEIDLD